MKLTLHIGTTKSGTTSLQRALFQCAPGLKKVGVYYDHRTLNQNRLDLLVRDPSRWPREFRSMDDHVRTLERKEAARAIHRIPVPPAGEARGLGRETRVEEICTSFDQDALERLTAGVMLHLARDRKDSAAPGTRLARLGSRIKRKLTGKSLLAACES